MKSKVRRSFGKLRRFYNRTLQVSPRSAGVFGVGLILLSLYATSLLLFMSIPILFQGAKWITVTFVLFFSSLIGVALGLNHFMAAVNYLFVRKRKFNFSVILIVAGIALFLLYPVFDLILLGVYLLIAAGFIFSGDKRKLKLWAFVPAAVLVLFMLALGTVEEVLKVKVDNAQNRLARTTGNAVRFKDVKKQCEAGFLVTKEPLKSVIALAPGAEGINLDRSVPELRRELEKYRKENAAFVSSLESLLKQDIKYIGRQFYEEDSLFCTIPGTAEIRKSFCYLDMTIRSYPEDKAEISSAHTGMIKLRDISLNTPDVIYGVLAISLENSRLRSVASTLGAAVWSRDDYFALIGMSLPKWKDFFLRQLAIDAAVMESWLECTRLASDNGFTYSFDSLLRCIPRQLNVYLLANQLAHLNILQTVADTVIENSNLAGKDLCEKIPDKARTGLIFYDSMWSDWKVYLHRIVAIQDLQKMAEIAFDVMDHYWRNGVIPDDLSFLGKAPRCAWDGSVFEYTRGELKGTDGKNIAGFRISFAGKESSSYRAKNHYIDVPLVPAVVRKGRQR